jgi:DNA-binding response OmpR family regulator
MPASFNGSNVLIVDDDMEVLSAVQTAFKQSGANVATANDGNKAVEMTRRLNPDLIILDMMLPRRSGFLVLEQIKPNKESGVKPFVIMMTATEGSIRAVRRHSADAYSKPFSMERLMEHASKLLGTEYRAGNRQRAM